MERRQITAILGHARRMPRPDQMGAGGNKVNVDEALALACLKCAEAIVSVVSGAKTGAPATSSAEPPSSVKPQPSLPAARAPVPTPQPSTEHLKTKAVTPKQGAGSGDLGKTSVDAQQPIAGRSPRDEQDSQSEILASLEELGCISPGDTRVEAPCERVVDIAASGSTSSHKSSQEEILASLEAMGAIATRAARVNAPADRNRLVDAGQ